jgi:lipopolysaccharide export system permease protein
MWRDRRLYFYLLREMIPPFLMGLVIFISILLMFQALRLTEFILIHGIGVGLILDIMGYMSLSFLPILLPMSLLFAILMSFNRLSLDSEIIALKSIGVPGYKLLVPPIALALVVTFVSMQTSFYVAPWGNRQFEILISHLGNTKAAASIKEGTFSEGFFEMVVYANKVDSDKGILQDLFIYDEKNPTNPMTIIAPEGQIIPDPYQPGHSVLLRLFSGQIHRKGQNHTVVNFDSFDIFLNDPIRFEERKKSPPSLSVGELRKTLNETKLSPKEFVSLLMEYHKRIALSWACLVFAFIGVAFGIENDRRSGKSSGFIVSIGFIIGYWVIYLASEGMGRSETIPAQVAVWLANIIFLIVAIRELNKKLI